MAETELPKLLDLTETKQSGKIFLEVLATCIDSPEPINTEDFRVALEIQKLTREELEQARQTLKTGSEKYKSNPDVATPYRRALDYVNDQLR